VRVSSAAKCASQILLVPALLVLFVNSSNGQGPAGPGIRGTGQQDIQSREWALTHISDEVRKHFGSQVNASLPQMREDFHELQVANNELMKSVFIKNSIELKRIQTSINEIRKRAVRLRTNLALGNSEGKESKTTKLNDATAEEIGLPSTLLLLDRAVMDFVNNPLFQQPKVLDMKLAIQAASELGEVLRLTEVIDRLAKHTKAQK
jgi:hypothetical protein